MDEYHAFIENIFDQNIEDASRKPQGTYPEEYRKWYKQGFLWELKNSSIVLDEKCRSTVEVSGGY